MFHSSSRLWQIATLVPLTLSATLPLPAESPVAPGEQGSGTWTFHHENVLGTSLQITVRADGLAAAQTAEAAILASSDHDTAVLSTWKPDSEVSRWQQTRMQPVAVSPELFEVLSAFDGWRDRTGGALDASVEVATRLWQNATAAGRLPSEQEIAIGREAMRQPHWSLDRTQRTATRLTDVPLALASFTKSYVSSRAADAGLQAGASGVMLNVGGDVIVRGNLLQMAAITNPQNDSENTAALCFVTLQNRAIATSGSYRRGFSLDSTASVPQFSHLFDPRTAQPTTHVLSSTVIAKDAVTAGALATAFSVLSVSESQHLAASFPGVEYLLVLPGGEQIASRNWPEPVLQNVRYQKKAAPAADAWNQAFELDIQLNLPRIEDARYRRPYVAVWVEDADHFPIRTIALWTEKPRWLPDLKQWYREDQVRSMTEGTDISRIVSSATRAPGRYTLKWDGTANEGKPVKAGRYTVCIEAAREHGVTTSNVKHWTSTGKPSSRTCQPPRNLELSPLTTVNDRSAKRQPQFRQKIAKTARWLHIYLSMVSFAVVLFFSVTGITLNHPTWFSNAVRTRELHGSVQPVLLEGIGDSEAAKATLIRTIQTQRHLHGAVNDLRIEAAEVSFSFRAPGYSADVNLDRQTGKYSITEVRNGFVAVINDLHKGRDSGNSWGVLIDVSAVFLTMVSLTGLIILWFVYKRRVSGLIVSLVGVALCLIVYAALVP